MPTLKGTSWVTSRVTTMLVASNFNGSSGETNGARKYRSIGAMIADDPARITINPTATATFPLASAVKAGPNGAPGQTARIRIPAATIGWGSNRSNRPTVTAGTQT